MKLKQAKNIFEALFFSTLWSKVIGFNFITIYKNKSTNYSYATNFLDFLRFFAWIIFSFSLAMDNLRNPFDPNSNRSFIFEFLVALNGKFGAFRAGFELMLIFFFRHEYFSILKNINWIDEKVKF